ncbi:hypothetical protein ACFLR3_02065 [Campylobacterota bacterium]
MTKSQEYVQNLFSDKLIFEKEVLHVKCDEDRKEVMTLMCKELCTSSKISHQINFLKLKSIDDINFDGVKIALVEILLAELISLLRERRYTRVEIDTIKMDKTYLKFMYQLAKTYILRFNTLLCKEIANTFFELLSTSDKPENVGKVVHEVINGNDNHKSLLEQHGGGQILYKADQAWMRVKQARDEKSRKAQVYQIEIVKLVRRVDQLKLHISAIAASRAVTLNEVKKVTPELLIDMFTDEDDIQLHTKKTMFSYLSSDELTNVLISSAQSAKNGVADTKLKGDFSQIADFFKKCKSVNTKKYIDTRFEEFKQELQIKSDRYRQQRLKLQTLRERPLDSFDVTLKRVKEAMVYNLQHMNKK